MVWNGLIPSVGCFLCSNLNGRRRNKVLLMYVDAVNWVVYQVLVAAFLGMLRLRLCRHPVSSGGSCRTCGQVMGLWGGRT